MHTYEISMHVSGGLCYRRCSTTLTAVKALQLTQIQNDILILL